MTMTTFTSIFGIKSSHASKHHSHVLHSASSSTSSMTPLTAAPTTSDDKNFAVLKELASLTSNRNCFDCLQRGPTYVNMTIGSFICTSCSGKLRGLNPPHRVKSISMAVFSDDEIDFLKTRGNDFCQKVWLGRYPGPLLPLEKENDSKLMDILTARYERKCWYVSPSDPMFDEARNKAELELNKKYKVSNSICKTTQTEINSSKMHVTSQLLAKTQQTDHNLTPQVISCSNAKILLQSAPIVRSPLKTFSSVILQTLPSSESPKLSFQPAATEFADFSNFSGSSTISSSSYKSSTATVNPLTESSKKVTPNLPYYFHHDVFPSQDFHSSNSIPEDKYAPFHELTAGMNRLSIDWNGSHYPANFSSQRGAWNDGEIFSSDSSENSKGKNPFAGASSNLSQSLAPPTQFRPAVQEHCFHFPSYIPFPPSTNPYAMHVTPLGLNQPVYEGMLQYTGSITNEYNCHNSSQTTCMYQTPYYYQNFLQYNPSNPFLNQQVESRNTNPFL